MFKGKSENIEVTQKKDNSQTKLSVPKFNIPKTGLLFYLIAILVFALFCVVIIPVLTAFVVTSPLILIYFILRYWHLRKLAKLHYERK